MNVKIASLIVLLFFVLFMHAAARQEDVPYSVNDKMVLNHLIGTWESMMTYESVPPEIKKNTANSTYGLMFQLWLIPEYRSTFLSKSMVKSILNTTHSYIQTDDPLEIKQYYKSGQLEGDGFIKAKFLMLNNASDIFLNEKDYNKMVNSFLKWLAEISK